MIPLQELLLHHVANTKKLTQTSLHRSDATPHSRVTTGRSSPSAVQCKVSSVSATSPAATCASAPPPFGTSPPLTTGVDDIRSLAMVTPTRRWLPAKRMIQTTLLPRSKRLNDGAVKLNEHYPSGSSGSAALPSASGCTAPVASGLSAQHEVSTSRQEPAPGKTQGQQSSEEIEKPGANKAADKCGKCDKCDGSHPTDACPHFKKPRENHKDALVLKGTAVSLRGMGSAGGNFILKQAKMVKQPGDGDCLYHSMCYCLDTFGIEVAKKGAVKKEAPIKPGTTKKQHEKQQQKKLAVALRRQLAAFIKENPKLKIAGDTFAEWVRWDANATCNAYARRMAAGGWGGGLELAACSRLKRINVHVYEKDSRGRFKRISCFNAPRVKKTMHVLYSGRMHYDALVVDK